MRNWLSLARACALLALLIASPWAILLGVVLAIVAPNGFPGLLLAAAGFALGAWTIYVINSDFDKREARDRGETE